MCVCVHAEREPGARCFSRAGANGRRGLRIFDALADIYICVCAASAGIRAMLGADFVALCAVADDEIISIRTMVKWRVMIM